ncbi:MAG: response regulator [Ichthyobacteriaceae bacterium]|nr:response regulator [Ichthyobacteriaceae bacterium]
MDTYLNIENKVRELEDENKQLRAIMLQWDSAENTLKSSNGELKKNEQKLTMALKASEYKNKSKSSFLANMSHEIRTPMNGIVGMVEVLSQSKLTSEQSHYLKIINSSAENLLVLINDILDFSKVEAGKIDLENIEFSIDEIIWNVVNILGLKAKDKGIELITYIDNKLPRNYKGDKVRIQQILTNLINNAIKFTPNGEIYISCESGIVKNNKHQVIISVQDSGIGIAKENLQKLFESYTQVDETITRRYGGTGLGLVISKKMTELMGGKINVESKVGTGSIFTFDIWLDNIEAKKNNDTFEAIEKNKSEINIMLVDDNAININVFSKYLESEGLNFKSYINPVDAYNTIVKEENNIDVFLLDYNMLEYNGIDLAKKIKLIDFYKNSKIIILSSLSLSEINDVYDNKIIDKFLLKPLRYNELIGSIYSSLKLLNKKSNSLNIDKAKICCDIHPLKVLVVDDNKVNLMVAKLIIGKMVNNIDIAYDGKEALEMHINNKYDIIFMDVHMPVMNGLIATSEIRKLDNYISNVPIVAMSASAMKEDIEACKKIGMDYHISKPYKMDDISNLLDKVSELVKQH